ncbi:MAG: hypothetical protein ACRDND_17780, partial [Streptosporangiaceae bacterium]
GLHPVDLSLWSMPSSAVRLQRLRAGAPGLTEPGPFRTLLADHADYPHSICAHPDPNLHPLKQGATIASVLMDLTARQMWVAPGPPCQVAYQQLDLSWLGSGGPARRACAAPTAARRR